MTRWEYWIVFAMSVSRISTLRERKRPNLILLVTDDLDVNSAFVLWETQNKIKDLGADMTNAYATTSICCPSRSSILTGLYAHNHNVMTNTGPICGGEEWQQKHERRTYAYYLHEHAKYRTAMFGKYLNEYNGSYVPPGWDTWHGLIKNSQYYNYKLRVKGWSPEMENKDEIEKHADDYADNYLTNLVANRSCDWLEYERRNNPDRPLLLTVNFPAPHGPEDAAVPYQSVFNDTTSPIPQNYNYVKNEKKHSLLRKITSPMNRDTIKFGNLLRRKRWQTLLSVDDAVKKIVTKIEQLGIIDETYFIFTSDHGYHIGQFGMVKGKSTPYEFDVKIPFYVRGPGISEKQTLNQIMLNIDIAPTMLGFAGITPPRHMDGLNMAGVLRGFFTETRDSFVIEKRGNSLNEDLSRLNRSRDQIANIIHKECQRYPRKYKDRASIDSKQPKCGANQSDICIWNGEHGEWRMVSCKLHGYVDPRHGQCNCNPDFVNKIGQDTKPWRTRKNRSKRRKKSVARSRRQSIRKKNRKDKTPNMTIHKLTANCGIKRDGKVECNLKTKVDWRNNFNEASHRRKNLNEQIGQINKVLRKLQIIKPSRSNSAKGKKSHIPCTCPQSNSFREKIEHDIREKNTLEKNKRLEMKERKLKRQTVFQRSCRAPGMNCFTVDNTTWLEPPRWEFEPQCHCTSASNSTFSCLRKIGHGKDADQNFLYCEFYEGHMDTNLNNKRNYFMEYYDLDNDPYQLDNIYDQLDHKTQDDLSSSLKNIKACDGQMCSCSTKNECGKTPGLLTTSKGKKRQHKIS